MTIALLLHREQELLEHQPGHNTIKTRYNSSDGIKVQEARLDTISILQLGHIIPPH